MERLYRALAWASLGAALGVSLVTTPVSAQDLSANDRDRGLMMLQSVRRNLREFYYDSTFHGLDLEALVRTADARIRRARSNSEIFSIIASLTLGLNDSHTYFVPPLRAAHVDYGWEMAAVADDVYVTELKPRSEAESRGLALGDRIISLNGIPMTRSAVWQARYAFELVSPRSQLALVVEHRTGIRAELDVPAEVVPGPRVRMVTGSFVELVREWENRRRELRSREYLAGGDVFVWRLVSFIQDDREIDRMIGRARRHRALVLDLRSNPGGNLSALEHLVSRLFTDRVLVAVVEGRDGADTGWADPGRHPYTGSLVVLVDSESASAAEMLARIVQLEGRGTVVGDRTAGRVMTSFVLEDLAGAHLLAPYAVSVTIGNVRMRDGRGLERVGVRPDSLVLPSAEDLAVGRDPVLAHAVSFLGGALTPEEAGQLFPRTRR